MKSNLNGRLAKLEEATKPPGRGQEVIREGGRVRVYFDGKLMLDVSAELYDSV